MADATSRITGQGANALFLFSLALAGRRAEWLMTTLRTLARRPPPVGLDWRRAKEASNVASRERI